MRFVGINLAAFAFSVIVFGIRSIVARAPGVVSRIDFAVRCAAMLADGFGRTSSRTARACLRGVRYGTAALVLFRMSSVSVRLVNERRFRMVGKIDFAVRVFANVAGRFVYAGSRTARANRLVVFGGAAIAGAGVPVISSVARPFGRPDVSKRIAVLAAAMLASRFLAANGGGAARASLRGNRYGTAALVLFRMSSVAVRLVSKRRFRVVSRVDFAVLAAAMLSKTKNFFFIFSSELNCLLPRSASSGTPFAPSKPLF